MSLRYWRFHWRQLFTLVLTITSLFLFDSDVNCYSYENPVVLGSLSMYPSTDDNYGIDSCSIMCLQTTPPIVIIAMCTGKIYHAILLREILDNDDDDRKVRYTINILELYILHMSWYHAKFYGYSQIIGQGRIEKTVLLKYIKKLIQISKYNLNIILGY